MAFVRSGNVTLYYGQTRVVGGSGYGWSRTSGSATNAYYLSFYPTGVAPSYLNFDRWVGISLRCLY